MMDVLRLLVKLGLQSVAAHKRKSMIVGGLMAFGAFIVVTGTAMLGSVERSMRSSIVNSVTGDIQVYDKEAPNELALFGGMGFGSEDVGEIERFDVVRDALLKVDNVKAVVPLGIANVNVSTPGDLDRALNALRDAVRKGDENGKRVGAESVRRILSTLQEQREKSAVVSSEAVDPEAMGILQRATSDALWQEFAQEPLATLDWLDENVGPLGEEGQMVYFRLAGTDLVAFEKHFDKLRIVQGEKVPPGQRGLLLGQIQLERELKMAVARNLDIVKKGIDVERKTIADDQLLRETLAKAVRLHPRILYDLDADEAKAVESELRKAMPGAKAAPGDLSALLVEFLTMDDSNFAQRYDTFYEVIAPRIEINPFRVGDTITLTAFTKTGFLRSINVKLYGTYTFEGLEKSDLAGALALTDLVTFRELYGARTAELDAELLAMKKEVGAAALDRASAEDELFGGDTAIVEEVATTASVADEKLERADDKALSTFTQEQIDQGLVLSAAVLLEDQERMWQTMAEIAKVGEPLGIQAVDWQRAAGIIGQFIWVIRGVLTIAILIIFAVAIVIINNSMVMATLERVAEIGTMRAIGAGKGFVTWMIIFETAVLGVIAGTAGALAGAAFIAWLGATGIPAGNDFLTFLFAGPRLFPSVGVAHLVAGLIATTVVSVAATLYPARLATAIQPVVAMQGKE